MVAVNTIKPVYPGWHVNPKNDQDKKDNQGQQPKPEQKKQPDEDSHREDGRPHIDDYV